MESAVKNEAFGAFLTCRKRLTALVMIYHGMDLLIAKLNENGLSLSALKLIHDYLINRKKKLNKNCFLLQLLGKHSCRCFT